MEYDSITVAIRQRNPKESIDLGFALTRRWWASIELGTLACLLPSALIFYLALSSYPLIALAVFWWFKPFYDRLPLFIFSRAFFGQRLSFELIAETPRFLGRHLTGDLSYRRFSPWRSYRLPVRLLEGLKGSAAIRKRLALITASGKLAAGGLTIVCLLFELMLAYGLFILVHIFTDYAPIGESMSILATDPGRLNSALTYWLYVLSVAFIEPFYIGAGFSLYVNRRINLEGWDIELVFRRLAERVKRIGWPKPNTLVLPFVLLVFLSLGSRSWTQSAPDGETTNAVNPPAPTGEEIEVALHEVLQHKEFGIVEQQTVWRPRWRRREARDRRNPGDASLPFLSDVATWVARIAPWILSGAALFLFSYLLVVSRGKRLALKRKTAADRQTDSRGIGPGTHEPEPEVLPEDWLAAAASRWQEGDSRSALSLLYRGGLAYFSETGRIDIPDSSTEMEALSRVRQNLARGSEHPAAASFERAAVFFEKATWAWLHQAYARQQLGQRDFNELYKLGTQLQEARVES